MKDGVVYTPPWVAELIVDEVLRVSPGLTDFRWVDPACGDGVFLIILARRIIEAMHGEAASTHLIRRSLESHIAGFDVDGKALEQCRANLDRTASSLGVTEVMWDLRQIDFLDLASRHPRDLGKIDRLVGNPPYIRIQHLPAVARRQIQQSWQFCRSGSTDIFVAFLEAGISTLAAGGILAFITSRSIFESETGRDFRRYVAAGRRLRSIIDFGNSQVFPEVSTYTAITVLSKDGSTQEVRLSKIDAGSQICTWTERVPCDEFLGRRWWILPQADRQFLLEAESRGPNLGTMSAIRVGLATLRDKVYLLRLAYPDAGLPNRGIVTVLTSDNREIQIESGACKRVVKASTVHQDEENQGLVIIFPYSRQPNNKLGPWTPSDQARFPLALDYLNSHRVTLESRGHSTRTWFEYGSTQGIATLFGPKLVIPPISRTGDLFLFSDPEATVISGYSIHFSGHLGRLHDRLRCDDFKQYARLTGRAMRGGYFALSKTSIENFSLSPTEWQQLGVCPSPNATHDSLSDTAPPAQAPE